MKFNVIGLNVILTVENIVDEDMGGPVELKQYTLWARPEDDPYRVYRFDFGTHVGMCSSGWTTASWGYFRMKASSIERIEPFNHEPKDKLSFYGDVVWDDERSEYKFVPHSLNSSSDEDEDGFDVLNSYDGSTIFSVSYDGGDPWYPNGGSRVNMDLFKPNVRWTGKRLVWLFYGPSGLGKSTLGAAINGHNVLETDRLNRLPDAILADVVIIGNRRKFTVDDVLPRLYGDPMVIKVGFEKL